jgi:glutamate racemase
MEIQKKFPHARYVYCSDNKNFPYGPKSPEAVIAAADSAIDALLLIEPLDVLVVACGTASTVVLPHLRSKTNIEVVGVVPAIKPAAAKSKTKVIGLLATPGTVQRPYTKQLIVDFASDCEVISIGSSELVQIAENHISGKATPDGEIAALLKPFAARSKDLDTVVLACTHFPLLKAHLSLALPFVKYWVDSGDAVARRIGSLLSAGKISSRPVPTEVIGYFTARTEQSLCLDEVLRNQFGFIATRYLN